MRVIIYNIGYGNFIARYITIEINSSSCGNYQDLICFEILTAINNFHIGYRLDTTYGSSLNVGSYRSRTCGASLTGFIG